MDRGALSAGQRRAGRRERRYPSDGGPGCHCFIALIPIRASVCTTLFEVQSLKGMPVVVTGAGRGIGKRLAIGFATRGARVGLVARSKAELDLCHLEIEHAGGSALRIRADVCDYEQVAAAVERMRAHFGSAVEILICAAGMLGPVGPFAEG